MDLLRNIGGDLRVRRVAADIAVRIALEVLRTSSRKTPSVHRRSA